MNTYRMGAFLFLWLISSAAIAQNPFAVTPDFLKPGPRMYTSFYVKTAPRCKADTPVKVAAFPSKMDCDDGDSTLFNGMLCAAGQKEGCDAVSESFNTDGWRRSPRLSKIPALRAGDSFSPDMAIGVQLYLLTQRSDPKVIDQARQWLEWLDASPPCWAKGVDGCVFQAPFPRFCKDDTEKGCTLRPGDAAVLAKTARALNLMPPPNSRLGAYLRQFEGLLPAFTLAESLVTEPGFPRHLIINTIWVQRLAGASSIEEAVLHQAASILARKEPANPYFAWAAGKPVEEYVELAKRVCPTKDSKPARRSQWAWERTDSEEAWKESMLWDCLFIARLGKVEDSEDKPPMPVELQPKNPLEPKYKPKPVPELDVQQLIKQGGLIKLQ